MMLCRLGSRLSRPLLRVPSYARSIAASSHPSASTAAPPTAPTGAEVDAEVAAETMTHPSDSPSDSDDDYVYRFPAKEAMEDVYHTTEDVAEKAFDHSTSPQFEYGVYHPDIDNLMKKWSEYQELEVFDGTEAEMPAREEHEVPSGEPRHWSYRAVTQNKLPGSEPPPNPYNSHVEYPPLDKLFTSKTNPATHTDADAAMGRMYNMPDNLDTLFPEGLAGDLHEHFLVTGDKAVLIPPAGVKLVAQLEAFRTATESLTDPDAIRAAGNALPAFKLVNGARGSGKSVLLNYVVQYARQNGWLCLFIPNCGTIMRDGLVLTQSSRDPSMIDQHDMATAMLRTFLTAHADKLETIPQRGSYTKDRYLTPELDEEAVAAKEKRYADATERRRRMKAEAEAAGKAWDPAVADAAIGSVEEQSTDIDRSQLTLKDMVVWGIAHPSAATDTLLDLKAELATVTEFPVLVAIDGIEALYPTSTEYPWEGEMLTPEQLTIPSALRMVSKEGHFDMQHRLQRGIVVATMSYKHEEKPMLVKKHCPGGLKRSIQHRVPPLTRWQMYALLSHLQQTERFFMLQEPIVPSTVEFFRTLTYGRPADLVSASMLAM